MDPQWSTKSSKGGPQRLQEMLRLLHLKQKDRHGMLNLTDVKMCGNVIHGQSAVFLQLTQGSLLDVPDPVVCGYIQFPAMA